MFRDIKHYGRDPRVVTRAAISTFRNPAKWARNHKLEPGSRIFTCSWSDWFHKDADPWRDEAWDIIRETPQFTYLILTKRPQRILEHLPLDWGDGWPNVWLGVSAERQKEADLRLPILAKVPAAIRFISAEPLLGPLNLHPYLCGTKPTTQHRGPTGTCSPGNIFHWVITGGESDPHPRKCDLAWVREIRDDCLATNTAFFHKQHGGSVKIDGSWGGHHLDGQIWREFPHPATDAHHGLRMEIGL
jgi:protein gp37